MPFLLVVFCIKGYFDKQLLISFSKSYNPYPRQFFIFLFTISLGLLIAIPQFIEKFKKPGSWSVDWIRLIAVGVPALYLLIQMIGYFSPLGKFFSLGFIVFSSNPATQYISGIILGYLSLSVLDKK
jgi:hypothetical protein